MKIGLQGRLTMSFNLRKQAFPEVGRLCAPGDQLFTAYDRGKNGRDARRIMPCESLLRWAAMRAPTTRTTDERTEPARENARVAAESLAKVARAHQIVITHGNGPQVGLLALQSAAYTAVEPYPLDMLGAESEGMIGYLIEQELGNVLRDEQPIATLLTEVEVDPNDPAFTKPSKPIGPIYTREEAEQLASRRGWAIAPDNDRDRCVVPSPLPKTYSPDPRDRNAGAGGGHRDLRRRRRNPRCPPPGWQPGRRRSSHRQGPRRLPARAGTQGRRLPDA